MHTFQPRDVVRTPTRRGQVGRVIRHHQTLPAWVVHFDGVAYDLSYTDDQLRGA